MPKRFEWLRQIKGVEREYLVMRLAADRTGESVRNDPAQLPSELRFRDFSTATARLEATYLIRMFAEFEAGLRQYWRTERTTTPGMHDLLNGIAASRRIPFDELNNAHEIRELRNEQVHDSTEAVLRISLADCRSALCTYFSFLPLSW